MGALTTSVACHRFIPAATRDALLLRRRHIGFGLHGIRHSSASRAIAAIMWMLRILLHDHPASDRVKDMPKASVSTSTS